MNKIIVIVSLTVAFIICQGTNAHAQFGIRVGNFAMVIGAPAPRPVYVAPAYVAPQPVPVVQQVNYQTPQPVQQPVQYGPTTPSNNGETAQLTDSQGRRWQITKLNPGVNPQSLGTGLVLRYQGMLIHCKCLSGPTPLAGNGQILGPDTQVVQVIR